METPNKSHHEPQREPGADEPNADVLWRSFCYLHDELSDEERAMFERDLADVESLQDAVAEAVVLTDIMRYIAPADLAPRLEAPRRPNRAAYTAWRRSSWMWLSVTAATLLVAVFGARWMFGPEVDPEMAVALAWADQLEEADGDAVDDSRWPWPDTEHDDWSQSSEWDGTYLSSGTHWNESWIFSAALESDDLEWDGDAAGTR